MESIDLPATSVSRPRTFLPNFSCPQCQIAGLEPLADRFVCSGCGAQFSQRGDGIIDLMYEKYIPKLRMYEDPSYLVWREILAEKHDYFYNTRGPVRWVQSAGHLHVKTILQNLEPDFVVEVGCGDGGHLRFDDKHERYIGLDIDRKALEKLKSTYPLATAVYGNGFRMPFADNSVPCAISVYNMEHMVYLDLVFEEISRVLTKDGVFIVSVPHVGGWAWELGRKVTSVREFSKPEYLARGLNYDRTMDLEHVNSIHQIDKAIRRHFKIEGRKSFPLVVPTLNLNLVSTYLLRKT